MSVMDEPRRDNRILMLTGHYLMAFVAAFVGLVIADSAAGKPGFLVWPVTVVSLAVSVAFMVDFNYHSERLCERCIAATPLNPQASVAQRKLLLRLHHSPFQLLALLIAVTWILLSVFSDLLTHRFVLTLVLDSVVVTLLGITYLVDWQHTRLYPWCPYCNWDDGGDEELAPDLPRVPETAS